MLICPLKRCEREQSEKRGCASASIIPSLSVESNDRFAISVTNCEEITAALTREKGAVAELQRPVLKPTVKTFHLLFLEIRTLL